MTNIFIEYIGKIDGINYYGILHSRNGYIGRIIVPTCGDAVLIAKSFLAKRAIQDILLKFR
jgi:hypothetical protein